MQIYTNQGLSNKIPHVSLQQTSGNGNHLFEIRKIPPGMRRHEDLFLPHRKDYFFFFLVTEGSNHHWIDFISYAVNPGNLYFTLPHQVHLKEQSATVGGILLAFTEEFLAMEGQTSLTKLPILLNPDDRHELVLTTAEREFLTNLFHQMLDEYDQEEGWKKTMLQSWLKIFLVYCSRLYIQRFNRSEGPVEAIPLVKSFRTLLGQHYDKLHQVAEYASLLNVSPGHLNDMVKEHTGISASSMIHDRLILESKRALFHSTLSVKEIGYSLGFEDAAYFNRFFKRLTGETPVAFRNTIREKYH